MDREWRLAERVALADRENPQAYRRFDAIYERTRIPITDPSILEPGMLIESRAYGPVTFLSVTYYTCACRSFLDEAKCLCCDENGTITCINFEYEAVICATGEEAKFQNGDTFRGENGEYLFWK